MYVVCVCVCVCVVVVFHIGTIVAVVVFAAVLCNVHSILLCMHWGGSCMHKVRSVLMKGYTCVFPAPSHMHVTGISECVFTNVYKGRKNTILQCHTMSTTV